MSNDLISRSALLAAYDKAHQGPPGGARKLIEEAPEALVCCKDCKYWLPMNRFHSDYHPGRGECELNCWVRDFNWFCADGERRDDDG